MGKHVFLVLIVLAFHSCLNPTAPEKKVPQKTNIYSFLNFNLESYYKEHLIPGSVLINGNTKIILQKNESKQLYNLKYRKTREYEGLGHFFESSESDEYFELYDDNFIFSGVGNNVILTSITLTDSIFVSTPNGILSNKIKDTELKKMFPESMKLYKCYGNVCGGVVSIEAGLFMKWFLIFKGDFELSKIELHFMY